MCILSFFYIKIYPFFSMNIFLTLEAGIYLVKLEFTFATQLLEKKRTKNYKIKKVFSLTTKLVRDG